MLGLTRSVMKTTTFAAMISMMMMLVSLVCWILPQFLLGVDADDANV